MFGGNSNWRGPIWFPMNFLMIESLQKFDFYYGDSFKIEFPTGSSKMLTLWEVSQELSQRLSNIFLKDSENRRAVFRQSRKNFKPMNTGAITFCFMNIFTATKASVWARATKLAGRV